MKSFAMTSDFMSISLFIIIFSRKKVYIYIIAGMFALQ